MKKMILTALTLVSTAALADAQKYVCNEYDRATDALKQTTLVVMQTGEGTLIEGESMPFVLEMYKGANVIPDLTVDGVVLTEDVMFNFESNDKTVQFHLYLDEMNESSLTIEGKDVGSFICR